MRSLVILGAVLAVSGCRCGGTTGTDGGVDSGLAYDEFDAWREMREVVRQSPDAVPARANALVAAKDLVGLFALVRDDIALLPTTPTGFADAKTRIRWGARAALRGQAGTPRERAELLKDLYVRAGFTAEVVTGTTVPGSTVTALLARGPTRTIHYAPTAEQSARWDAALKPDPRLTAKLPTPLDADGGVRASIVSAVKPLLPAPPAPTSFDATLAELPLVRVVVDGGSTYANPNLDGAMFGQSLTVATPEVADAPVEERQLRVVLSGARSSSPRETFVLAEHTWNASDVAGRTITAAFTTPLSHLNASRTRVGDATAFVPMLLVRGDGLDLDATQKLSVVGTPVLRDGARVTRGATGEILLDGEPLAPGPTAPAMLMQVQTLSTSISAAAFPDVELLLSARGPGNLQLPNLASDAFVVQEDGVNMVASLRRTRAGAPKVVLLFDRSTSIPAEFQSGAATVGHAVADAIFTQFPGSQVQVAAIDINGPTVAGPMVSTLADVDTQLAALSGTGSEVWTALDAFAESKASCIVAITDAVVDDTLNPEIAARLVSGPPVILAGVGTVDAATAAKIADLTHGKFLTGVTASNLPGGVTAFLAERQAYDYRIVYRSPSMGTATRVVAVSIRAPGSATTTTMYAPPSSPVAASALSALYLTVETGGHAVTRTLAGSAKATAADVEQVAGALFGRAVLAVEAGAPSFSTLLDEHLTERLQLEAGIDALRGTDEGAVTEAAKQRVVRAPPDLRFFSAAMPEESAPGDVTFVDGLTVTLHLTRPELGKKIIRRIDMLPLAPRETVSFSGAQTFATTTERSAALAAFETVRFGTNTYNLLRGKTLGLFNSNSVESLGAAWVGVAYPAYADYHVLAPTSGSPVAFWAVHKRTGELIGAAPTGGVGEGESTEALVNRLLTILDAAGRAGEAFGYAGVKEWADLEATKVTLLGGVIELFEGEGANPRGDLANNLCSFGVDALGGQIPGWDAANQLPNDLASLYRLGGQAFGREMPEVPTPSGAACSALLGQ